MDNRIEPGKHIDNWHFGMSQEEVIASFDAKPKKEGTGFSYKDHFFGFDKNKKLIFIEVSGKYDGHYLGVGIGSTLKEVSEKIGTPYYDSDKFSIEIHEAPCLRLQLTPSKMNMLYELEVTDLEDIDHIKGLSLNDLKISKIAIRAPVQEVL